VGEPVFGRKATDVSMGRLLAQLFEITALFDMRLRPELVLLQKTMVTVEGVARRLDPGHDIWAAAEPVVARWMTRELSPANKVRELAREARAAVTALAKLGEASAAQSAARSVAAGAPESGDDSRTDPERTHPAIWFFAGAAVSALGFVVGVALHQGLAR
jgi:ubiquinone biosynthesis protein